jgi:hypothetical protein
MEGIVSQSPEIKKKKEKRKEKKNEYSPGLPCFRFLDSPVDAPSCIFLVRWKRLPPYNFFFYFP